MLCTAKFIPSNGFFTKTVNVEDTGVVINMTVRNTSDTDNAPIKWRKDGGEEISQDGLAHFTIQGPVQPSDGGIYEIYYEGERSSGRGGIFRLIVRGKYHEKLPITVISLSLIKIRLQSLQATFITSVQNINHRENPQQILQQFYMI